MSEKTTTFPSLMMKQAKQASPSKFTSSVDLYSKKALQNLHMEEMNSRLKDMSNRFFERINELNRNLQEMDEIDNIALSDPLSKTPLKSGYNFLEKKVPTSHMGFHNDKALVGAIYRKNSQRPRFSRRKCRDLKEILRFSVKPLKSQLLNPFKYRDFISKFDNEAAEDLTRIENKEDFKELEKAQAVKINEKRRLIIKDLVFKTTDQEIINRIRKTNDKGSSISPKKSSPSKHSKNVSFGSRASPKKSQLGSARKASQPLESQMKEIYFG